jgi:hypothetical protein
LNGTHQLLAYADDVNLLGHNIDTISKNTQTITDASKEIGLEGNVEKTKYMLVSRATETNQGPLIDDHNVWPSLPLSSPSQHKSAPRVVSQALLVLPAADRNIFFRMVQAIFCCNNIIVMQNKLQ